MIVASHLIEKTFTKDLFAKVLSILLATAFFLFYRYLNLEHVSFSLPIQINILKDLAVFSQDITTAKVTVTGTKEDIAQFDRRNLFLEVNITEIEKESIYRINISRNSYINQLSGINFSITPSVIFIQLEPIITKKVTVDPVLLGQPAKGFSQSDIKLNPPTVEIRGPQSLLEDINIIRTSPIDINNMTKPISQAVSLNFDNPKIQIHPTQIYIDIDIASSYQYVQTLNLPITIINLTPNLYVENIDSLMGEVTVKGYANSSHSDHVNEITLTLDLNEIHKAGNYLLKPQLNNLKYFTENNIAVNNVRISIKEKSYYE